MNECTWVPLEKNIHNNSSYSLFIVWYNSKNDLSKEQEKDLSNLNYFYCYYFVQFELFSDSAEMFDIM